MTGALKSCCTALSVLLLLGCSEGYPGKSAPLISPFDMGNEQRLSALNEIGAEAHPQRRWSFALSNGCRLEVGHKRKNSRRLTQVFELRRGMDVDVSFDEPDQTFDVHLLASAAADAPRLGTLLESEAWTDAVQADLLLQLLMRDCGASPSALAD
ncbi:hypothetical protein OOZ63_09380 [Paucibacter sp. PLA-PC-4]|uniref:hypothetical protein n=1 Tax=Paucibacter sp. PLA-PC-4 TaxID=2993655 RepID=UPI002249239A|nr:hypothetical protein [Paucibacter sp. PLA-PC-4]MCX2862051.1 hypothetical protein [Paucibacter sp. PLA-PC-4]